MRFTRKYFPSKYQVKIGSVNIGQLSAEGPYLSIFTSPYLALWEHYWSLLQHCHLYTHWSLHGPCRHRRRHNQRWTWFFSFHEYVQALHEFALNDSRIDSLILAVAPSYGVLGSKSGVFLPLDSYQDWERCWYLREIVLWPLKRFDEKFSLIRKLI